MNKMIKKYFWVYTNTEPSCAVLNKPKCLNRKFI